jgi:hypothetical protein
MAGKGDKVRPFDKKEFDKNFDAIDWDQPELKTFKTSWGVEYTVKVAKEKKKDEDKTFTTEGLINKPKNIAEKGA